MEFGIKPETADVYWPLCCLFPEVCDNGDNIQSDHPAWSLGALIKLMTDIIIQNDMSCCGLSILNIRVYYQSLNGKEIVRGFEKDNIFENCISMIEFLLRLARSMSYSQN